MTTFKELNLPETISNSLNKMGFTTPTPIQAKAIPLALTGRDVLGSAQTGTGKTAAYAIPLVAYLLANPMATALVMTPTRELATQVDTIMKQLVGNSTDIKSAVLIGGDSMQRQIRELRSRPRLIVGTPGRINDHLTRGNLMLNKAHFLVLDETDKMLDMGFEIQIDKIVKYLPRVRQTLMFSATMPDNITKLAQKYLNNPERITIGSVSNPIAKITQENIFTTTENKYNELVKQLDARSGTIIVFVKTKRGADKLCNKLRKEHHSADAIHGDLRQSQRDRVIASFRNKTHRILIATDVAARGLDIPHIEHVINYDLPMVPEDYIHRIGRTGRAGAEGSAVCLITPDDNKRWRAIDKMLNPGKKQEAMPRHAGGKSNNGGRNKNRGGSNNNPRDNYGRNNEQRTQNSNFPRPKHERNAQRPQNNQPRPNGDDFGNLVKEIQVDGNKVDNVTEVNFNEHADRPTNDRRNKKRFHKGGYKGKSFRFNDSSRQGNNSGVQSFG